MNYWLDKDKKQFEVIQRIPGNDATGYRLKIYRGKELKVISDILWIPNTVDMSLEVIHSMLNTMLNKQIMEKGEL